MPQMPTGCPARRNAYQEGEKRLGADLTVGEKSSQQNLTVLPRTPVWFKVIFLLQNMFQGDNEGIWKFY